LTKTAQNVYHNDILRVPAVTHHQTQTVCVAALDALPKQMDESHLQFHCHNCHLHRQVGHNSNCTNQLQTINWFYHYSNFSISLLSEIATGWVG